jgi:hypothetical protein
VVRPHINHNTVENLADDICVRMQVPERAGRQRRSAKIVRALGGGEQKARHLGIGFCVAEIS